MSIKEVDAIIIGAGISGISAAYHLQQYCPGKTYKILERRDQLGGTWDLFNYPGIRSDSDMHTFGFAFYPWKDKQTIAEKDKILQYLHDTTQHFAIAPHIEYQRQIEQVEWSSAQARWTVSAKNTQSEESEQYRCQTLFMCVGYYDYDHAHNPEFANLEAFEGQVIHPQFWPKDTNYSDKNIIIIGSGATAITLLPALAEKAKHVTLLQRSPTYLASKPAEHKLSRRLSKWFGYWAARWWLILDNLRLYMLCRLFPAQAKTKIIGEIENIMGDQFDAKHFTPYYKPWDQRVCLCPDGDFFKALKSDKASIVTEQIERFNQTGIQLKSGEQLDADMVVTATGLKLLFLGGITIIVDGEPIQAPRLTVYKGFMSSGVPNMFVGTGYTNASWTLKVDLTNRHACRLINYMDKHDYDFCTPHVPDLIKRQPYIDLSSGYIQRNIAEFPRQGNKTPWKVYQNFILDNLLLRFSPVTNKALIFSKNSLRSTHN